MDLPFGCESLCKQITESAVSSKVDYKTAGGPFNAVRPNLAQMRCWAGSTPAGDYPQSQFAVVQAVPNYQP